MLSHNPTMEKCYPMKKSIILETYSIDPPLLLMVF